jgi:hypothetical protein
MNRIFTLAALAAAVGAATLSFAQNPPRQGGGGQRQGGGFGGGMMGMMGGGLQPLSFMMLREDVQKDLKITAEQKTKMDALREEQMAGFRPGGGQGGGGAAGGGQRGGGAGGFDMEAIRTRLKEADTKVLALLTEDQKKRSRQIQIQLSGLNAFLDEAVATELGLRASQKRDIEELQEKMNEANRSTFMRARNQEISMEDAQKTNEANSKIALEEAMKLLNDEQKTKFAEMSGPKFEAQPQPRGRRGGGN